MKTKKWCMIMICITLASQVFAERMTSRKPSIASKPIVNKSLIQETNENWLSHQRVAGGRPDLGDTDGNEDKPDPPIPIRSALPFLLGLSLVYGTYLHTKKRKTVKI